MSFLEMLSIVWGAAGLFASILGTFLTYAARHNGEATRTLVRSMEERTTSILERMSEMLQRMSETQERMDVRADERHREAIEAIRTLRA